MAKPRATGLALALLAALLGRPAAPAQAQTPPAQVVFAAASLSDALRQINTLWVAQGHPALVLSFAASSTLARQISQGAPADLFASADERWMDDLAGHNLVVANSRSDLLANQLALVVPATDPRQVTIGHGFDLAALLGKSGRLAVGDPASVPAGIYAAQALHHLGLWDALQPRLAPAEDVRAALLLVQRGEAPAGIVYSTDAAASPGVRIAGIFPADSHDPIRYPFALTPHGDTAQGRALLQFLHGPAARAVFQKLGFAVE